MWFVVQFCCSWQDFNWHSSSCGPCAISYCCSHLSSSVDKCVWCLGPVQASSFVLWIHARSSGNVWSGRYSTRQHILPSPSSRSQGGGGTGSFDSNGSHTEDRWYHLSAVPQCSGPLCWLPSDILLANPFHRCNIDFCWAALKVSRYFPQSLSWLCMSLPVVLDSIAVSMSRVFIESSWPVIVSCFVSRHNFNECRYCPFTAVYHLKSALVFKCVVDKSSVSYSTSQTACSKCGSIRKNSLLLLHILQVVIPLHV